MLINTLSWCDEMVNCMVVIQKLFFFFMINLAPLGLIRRRALLTKLSKTKITAGGFHLATASYCHVECWEYEHERHLAMPTRDSRKKKTQIINNSRPESLSPGDSE